MAMIYITQSGGIWKKMYFEHQNYPIVWGAFCIIVLKFMNTRYTNRDRGNMDITKTMCYQT